jgi:hypothetical protein
MDEGAASAPRDSPADAGVLTSTTKEVPGGRVRDRPGEAPKVVLEVVLEATYGRCWATRCPALAARSERFASCSQPSDLAESRTFT